TVRGSRARLEKGGLAPLQSAQNRKSESPTTRGGDARCLQAAQEEVKPVHHDSEAQSDIFAAVRFYEGRQQGLGEQFLRGGAHRAKNRRTPRVVRVLRRAGPKLSCAEVSLQGALRERLRSDLDYRAGPFVAHAR